MEIGNKISELRKKENYSQQQLADKIDVTRQTISNWESNITFPDLNQAKKLCSIFLVSLDDLIDNDLEIKYKDNSSSILSSLVGKECYIDSTEEDYRLYYGTLCKVLEYNGKFIKLSFKKGKETITKMLDINFISSFKIVTKKEGDN